MEWELAQGAQLHGQGLHQPVRASEATPRSRHTASRPRSPHRWPHASIPLAPPSAAFHTARAPLPFSFLGASPGVGTGCVHAMAKRGPDDVVRPSVVSPTVPSQRTAMRASSSGVSSLEAKLTSSRASPARRPHSPGDGGSWRPSRHRRQKCRRHHPGPRHQCVRTKG